MNQTKITPFLITNPIIIGLVILQIFLTSLRGGFGMIMLDFFFFIALIAAVTLYLDRVFVKKINHKIIIIAEIVIFIISVLAINSYLYD